MKTKDLSKTEISVLVMEGDLEREQIELILRDNGLTNRILREIVKNEQDLRARLSFNEYHIVIGVFPKNIWREDGTAYLDLTLEQNDVQKYGNEYRKLESLLPEILKNKFGISEDAFEDY